MVEHFVKTKDFLICVDSDGCAMDTMDCKHHLCFGPCMVAEWDLAAWEEPILKRWNDLNLYTMTRGINRFKGLAMALKEIDETYTKIEGIDVLCDWVEHAKELSNQNLQSTIEGNPNVCLKKALAWSNAVNASIEKLPFEKKLPFEGVLDALKTAHVHADIAVVSSANKEAVVKEWTDHHLFDEVDILMTQDAGSKSACIAKLLECGYSKNHVLMIGDAPGDKDAAEKNEVYYYPILVRKEAESWKTFREEALKKFLSEDYETYGKEKKQEFLKNLGAK